MARETRPRRSIPLHRLLWFRILPFFVAAALFVFVLFICGNFYIRETIFSRYEEESAQTVLRMMGRYAETLELLDAQYRMVANTLLDGLQRVFVADVSAEDIQKMELDYFVERLEAKIRGGEGEDEDSFYPFTLDAGGRLLASSLPPRLSPFPAGMENIVAATFPGRRRVLSLAWDPAVGRYFVYAYWFFPDHSAIGVALPIDRRLLGHIFATFSQLRSLPFVGAIGFYDPISGKAFGEESKPSDETAQGVIHGMIAGGGKSARLERDNAVHDLFFLWEAPPFVPAPFGLPKLVVFLRMDFAYFSSRWNVLFPVVLSLVVAGFAVALLGIWRASRDVTAPVAVLARDMERFIREQESYVPDPALDRTPVREVEDLTRAFNHMAGELAANFQQLKATNEALSDLYREQEVLTARMERLVALAVSLADAPELDEETFLSKLLRIAMEIVPEADCGSVATVRDDEWHFIDAVGHDLAVLRGIRLPASQMILSNDRVRVVKEILDAPTVAAPSEVLEELRKGSLPIRETVLVPLRAGSAGRAFGQLALDISTNRSSVFSSDSLRILDAFGCLATAFLGIKALVAMQGRFQREIVMSMISILELYDAYTKGHSENVAELTSRLAEHMGLDGVEVQKAYWAGLVHDIGKLLVPVEILNKPARLTEEEYEIVKTHPSRGRRVLGQSEDLAELGVIVESHHERWDGRGYPGSLLGEEIPLLSRLLAVADAFDAMTSNRAYREGLGLAHALHEIGRGAGAQFDPQVAAAFVEMMREMVPGIDVETERETAAAIGASTR